MISVCAIIAGNYLPYMRVLADSFFLHHPGGSLTVLVIDDEAHALDPDDARIDWRRLHDIGLEAAEIHRLAGIYDVTELATAVKPLFLRRLLDEGRDDVIYLDPDIRIFGSLNEVAALARQHGLVLTPHTMEPLPKDDRQIDDLFILAAGVYNLGFVAVGAAARPFLDWWWQCTRREALIDVTRMMFTDQRWVDFVPSLFEPYILKDPGYNVAYWNLHARRVTAVGDPDDVDGDDNRRYLVDGVPLRFFHFSGFETQRAWLLSRHQGDRPRVLLSEHPVLARICGDYAVALHRAGLDRAEPRPYGWRAAASGLAINARMRRLYWTAVRAAERGAGPEPPDPFDTANPDAFLDWLNAPAEGGPRRVSRYLYSIFQDRRDLQLAFPDIYGVHAAAYAEWIWRHGDVHEEIPIELLPPRSGDDLAVDGAAPVTLMPGLNIAGYFRGEMGIGEAARLLVRAADDAQIPHATVMVEGSVHRQQHPFDDRAAGAHPYEINLLCVNADMTPRFARDVGPAFFAGRHTVGYWFWEVDPFPAAMWDGFHHVDEVWTATDYMADILRAVGWRPVYTVPMPVPVPTFSPAITRTRLGLPEDRFLVLAIYDFLSIAPRKNPLGAIAAFTAAFAPDEGPVLVLKSINGHLRVPELEQVRMAAAGRPDIIVLDCYFSVEEKNALLGACDCQVSLHRAEGLGLTMAEAMSLGKPVIATGYSGNRHYMTPENSFLVDYAMEPIPAGCLPYPAGGRWAAPDLDHAARLLREVYDRPADALRRARRGQADILDRHGVRTAAAAMTRRIEAIRDERRQRMVVPAMPAQADLSAQVDGSARVDVPVQVDAPIESDAAAAARIEAPVQAGVPAQIAVPMQAGISAQIEVPMQTDVPVQIDVPMQVEAPAKTDASVQIAAEVAAQVEAQVEAGTDAPPAMPTPDPAPAAAVTVTATALETLRPLLEQLAGPRLSAEGRAWPGLRLTAQRALFRLLRPYWFQQRQFQDALIGGLVSSLKTLASEVATLRAAADASEGRADAQMQMLTEAKHAAEVSLAKTETSIARLSDRVFAIPYIAGRERFVQRGPAGDARLGYGTPANGASGVTSSNGHASHGSTTQAAAPGAFAPNGHGPRRVEIAHHDANRNAYANGGGNGTGNGTATGSGSGGGNGGGGDNANGSGNGISNGNGNGHRHSDAAHGDGTRNGGGHHDALRPEPLFRIRQRLYLPLLTPRAPVLDIGCGRGGMLDLLRIANVRAVGIDRDPDMVVHCRRLGHQVEQADAVQFLRTRPDASVASIFSARLIEQLPFEELQEFLRLCRRRLSRGGLLIAETENPRGFDALERPEIDLDADATSAGASVAAAACAGGASAGAGAIGPELALALCELAGFERAHVLFPTGTGDLDPDRQAQRQYTLVATTD
jgi:glycosyltransferase involved in cell wall biosynthesis